MTTKEKLYEYLKVKGITPTKVESSLNWGKGSLIKPQSISLDKAEEFLLHFPDLSAEWLLRGTGSMILDEQTVSADEAFYKKIIDDQHDLIQMLKQKVELYEKSSDGRKEERSA